MPDETWFERLEFEPEAATQYENLTDDNLAAINPVLDAIDVNPWAPNGETPGELTAQGGRKVKYLRARTRMDDLCVLWGPRADDPDVPVIYYIGDDRFR